MNRSNEHTLLKLANSAGYLLQLGLARSIADAGAGFPWRLASQEHAWQHESGQEGVIDLVLQHKQYVVVRLVVECKRVTDGQWLFLVPQDAAAEVQAQRCLWVHTVPGQLDLSGWDDLFMKPYSGQSQFCVIRGTGDNREPYLERIVRSLLLSVEALAAQEASMRDARRWQELFIYVPVVVTTADLVVGRFDSHAVALDSGTLRQEDASFSTVPFLRFRKSLVTADPKVAAARDLEAADAASIRGSFVVNASHLLSFLRTFDLPKVAVGGEPWDRARAGLGPL